MVEVEWVKEKLLYGPDIISKEKYENSKKNTKTLNYIFLFIHKTQVVRIKMSNCSVQLFALVRVLCIFDQVEASH